MRAYQAREQCANEGFALALTVKRLHPDRGKALVPLDVCFILKTLGHSLSLPSNFFFRR
jgi:hypothetical protein